MLEPFFLWMQELPLSGVILNATWASPILQCIHLVAICVFSGAILIVDIRLLGKGLISTPLAELATMAEKWLVGSFAALIVTGVPQMMSTALKQYYSPHFWLKMQVMLFGLIFTFTIRRKMTRAAEGQFGVWWLRLIGVISIVTWTTVAIWARLIGLLS